MEKCEYCGTLCEDGAVKCASCGGNSFLHVCNHCQTEFRDGMYCPRCGVRAGQKARTCPQCNTEYFTEACPQCGYSPNHTRVIVERSAEPKKKRHTVLWVLGWIFFFPIPLTVLIARSKLKPWLKGVLIAALWGILLFYGANDSDETESVSDPPPITLQAQEK